jgi:hypothetical protein
VSASRERAWLLLLPRLLQRRQMQQEGSFPAWKEEWDGSEGSSSSDEDEEEGGSGGSSSEDRDDDIAADGDAGEADEEAQQQPAPRRSSRVPPPAHAHATVDVVLARAALYTAVMHASSCLPPLRLSEYASPPTCCSSPVRVGLRLRSRHASRSRL